MSTKNTNYTPEMTATLKAGYAACDSDESRKDFIQQFADEYGKKPASIRAKLVREGVYVKAETPRKRSATKSELVEAIAARVGADSEKLDSLAKATVKALEIVLRNLPQDEENTEEMEATD